MIHDRDTSPDLHERKESSLFTQRLYQSLVVGNDHISRDATRYYQRITPFSWIITTGIAVPDYNMGAVYGGNLEEELSAISTILRERQLPGMIFIPEVLSSSIDFAELDRFGLQQADPMGHRILRSNEIIQPAKLLQACETELVSDLATLDSAIQVQAQAFDFPYDLIRSTMGSKILADELVKTFVAHSSDGEVVSTVMTVIDNEIGSIWNMATLPKYQRQGFASKVLFDALQFHLMGGNVAQFHFLETPVGKPFYDSFGFRTYENTGVLTFDPNPAART